MKNIYAIRDNVAKTITVGLHLFPADAAAVRFFGDIASDPNTNIARHVGDYDLVRLGSLDDEDCILIPDSSDDAIVVITGSGWKAAQAPAEASNGQLSLASA